MLSKKRVKTERKSEKNQVNNQNKINQKHLYCSTSISGWENRNMFQSCENTILKRTKNPKQHVQMKQTKQHHTLRYNYWLENQFEINKGNNIIKQLKQEVKNLQKEELDYEKLPDFSAKQQQQQQQTKQNNTETQRKEILKIRICPFYTKNLQTVGIGSHRLKNRTKSFEKSDQKSVSSSQKRQTKSQKKHYFKVKNKTPILQIQSTFNLQNKQMRKKLFNFQTMVSKKNSSWTPNEGQKHFKHKIEGRKLNKLFPTSLKIQETINV